MGKTLKASIEHSSTYSRRRLNKRFIYRPATTIFLILENNVHFYHYTRKYLLNIGGYLKEMEKNVGVRNYPSFAWKITAKIPLTGETKDQGIYAEFDQKCIKIEKYI